MKILGINASPKGGRSETAKLVRAVLDGAKAAGAKTEFADVCKLNIEYCIGCGVCYKKGKCFQKDDFAALYDKILAADGIVVGSPNYFRSVSAQLKTVIDRMADAIHCQLLSGKYAVVAATSGGTGQDRQVTDYLTDIMVNFGAFVTGTAGVAVQQGPKRFRGAVEKAFRLGETLVSDIGAGKIHRKQAKLHAANRAYFQALTKMHGDEWASEYRYWDAKGWK